MIYFKRVYHPVQSLFSIYDLWWQFQVLNLLSVFDLSVSFILQSMFWIYEGNFQAIFPKYAWLEEVEHQGGNPAEYSEYSPVPHPDPGSLAVRGCWGLWHPFVLMSAYHQLLACPFVFQIDNIICEQPCTKKR